MNEKLSVPMAIGFIVLHALIVFKFATTKRELWTKVDTAQLVSALAVDIIALTIKS